MKKKSVLLMNTTLGIGGITASMMNAANELSKDYDVSIFCYNPSSTIRDRLCKEVKVIEPTWHLIAMSSAIGDCKKIGFKYFLYKFFSRCWSVIFNNRFPIYLAISHQKHLGNYDLACSFTHEVGNHIEYTGLIRVLLRKADAPLKLSWVHCDYNYVKKTTFNNRYFNAVDAIVGVSDSVAAAFKKNNPKVTTPIDTCYNMLDYKKIYEMADQPQKIKFKENGIICFSACRLSVVKGIDRALTALSDILTQNNVYWYIAGDGSEFEKIESIIVQQGLKDRVIMLGEQTNPFNFMKNADLYLSVSYEEAAPLVYMEAKALHVPIFSTRTLSTDEMLDGTIDFICDNNAESLREVFDYATSDRELLKQRKALLESYVGNNDRSIQKFKHWLGDDHG